VLSLTGWRVLGLLSVSASTTFSLPQDWLLFQSSASLPRMDHTNEFNILLCICNNMRNLTPTMLFTVSNFISAASMYRVATGYCRFFQRHLLHAALSTARLCLQRLGILHLQLFTSPCLGPGYWMGYICLCVRIRRLE